MIYYRLLFVIFFACESTQATISNSNRSSPTARRQCGCSCWQSLGDQPHRIYSHGFNSLIQLRINNNIKTQKEAVGKK